MRLLLTLTALLLPIVTTLSVAAAAEPTRLLRDFSRAQLLVITQSVPSCRLFDVYLALTREQQIQGLMYVESLDWHEGMLFVYQEPRDITMWMKNTYIPLDMLFLTGDGRVGRIEAETTPLSERTIHAGVPAIAVLELRGGAAARFGLAPGDRVVFPAG